MNATEIARLVQKVQLSPPQQSQIRALNRSLARRIDTAQLPRLTDTFNSGPLKAERDLPDSLRSSIPKALDAGHRLPATSPTVWVEPTRISPSARPAVEVEPIQVFDRARAPVATTAGEPITQIVTLSEVDRMRGRHEFRVMRAIGLIGLALALAEIAVILFGIHVGL